MNAGLGTVYPGIVRYRTHPMGETNDDASSLGGCMFQQLEPCGASTGTQQPAMA